MLLSLFVVVGSGSVSKDAGGEREGYRLVGRSLSSKCLVRAVRKTEWTVSMIGNVALTS